jgi:pimeloyl-ACP methyl ester carboxylesterase
VAGPDWYNGAAARIAASLKPDSAVVVVAHSGAGGLVPSLADQLGERLVGAVFVDAVMPYPGRSWFDTTGAGLAAHVRALARDAVLPTWDTWFDPQSITKLLPDPVALAAFRAELPRLPFAYFETLAPDDLAWEGLPAAYLQLSDAYAAEAASAARKGWTVRREPLHHLAMLSHPDRVAAAIAELAGGLV